MGIQKTRLNNTKIKNILKKEYNIDVLKILKIDRGTSNIFKIETNKNIYILKEFISAREKDDIIKEINIIKFLREKNMNVPVYIKTKNKKYFIENEGRVIVVQEFIEGNIIENNTGTYNQVIECANILGRLTKELMDYPELSEEDVINKNFSKNRVHEGIKKLIQIKETIKKDNKYKEKIEKDLDYRIKILEEIENEFDFSIIKKMTMLNSHGDFCSQQLIYNDNNGPTIIDFEKAKKLPIVWEIIRSYSYIDKKFNIENLTDYFKEIIQYIDLNEYDLKYASYLYLLQLASSSYGYKEYSEDCNQKELLDFAFFRTNLCKILHENLENISLELEKIKNVKINKK